MEDALRTRIKTYLLLSHSREDEEEICYSAMCVMLKTSIIRSPKGIFVFLQRKSVFESTRFLFLPGKQEGGIENGSVFRESVADVRLYIVIKE